jgi:hypothetical protein
VTGWLPLPVIGSPLSEKQKDSSTTGECYFLHELCLSSAEDCYLTDKMIHHFLSCHPAMVRSAQTCPYSAHLVLDELKQAMYLAHAVVIMLQLRSMKSILGH